MITDRFPGVRALIFDCDGTLVDSGAIYALAWAAGLKSSGHSMDELWYHERCGLSGDMLLDEFEQKIGEPLDRARVVEHVWRFYQERVSDLVEISAVTSIAREHHGRLPMAVASSGTASFVRLSLQARALDRLFDTIVTIEDVTAAKPAPDLFLEAARRLGVAPADCLVFEDSAQGVQAAMAAGCRVISVQDLRSQLSG